MNGLTTITGVGMLQKISLRKKKKIMVLNRIIALPRRYYFENAVVYAVDRKYSFNVKNNSNIIEIIGERPLDLWALLNIEADSPGNVKL